jgi:hypothetical protein
MGGFKITRADVDGRTTSSRKPRPADAWLSLSPFSSFQEKQGANDESGL